VGVGVVIVVVGAVGVVGVVGVDGVGGGSVGLCMGRLEAACKDIVCLPFAPKTEEENEGGAEEEREKDERGDKNDEDEQEEEDDEEEEDEEETKEEAPDELSEKLDVKPARPWRPSRIVEEFIKGDEELELDPLRPRNLRLGDTSEKEPLLGRNRLIKGSGSRLRSSWRLTSSHGRKCKISAIINARV